MTALSLPRKLALAALFGLPLFTGCTPLAPSVVDNYDEPFSLTKVQLNWQTKLATAESRYDVVVTGPVRNSDGSISDSTVFKGTRSTQSSATFDPSKLKAVIPGEVYTYTVSHYTIDLLTTQITERAPDRQATFTLEEFAPPVLQDKTFEAEESVVLDWKLKIQPPTNRRVDTSFEVEIGRQDTFARAEGLEEIPANELVWSNTAQDYAIQGTATTVPKQIDASPLRQQTIKGAVLLEPRRGGDRAHYYYYRVRQKLSQIKSPWSKPAKILVKDFEAPPVKDVILNPITPKFQVDWEDVEGAKNGYVFEFTSGDDFSDRSSVWVVHTRESFYNLRKMTNYDNVGKLRRMNNSGNVRLPATNDDLGERRSNAWRGFSHSYRFRVAVKDVSDPEHWSWGKAGCTFEAPPEIRISDVIIDRPVSEVRLRWTKLEGAERYFVKIYTKEQLEARSPPHWGSSNRSQWFERLGGDKTAVNVAKELRRNKTDEFLGVDFSNEQPYENDEKLWLSFGTDYHYQVFGFLPGINTPFASKVRRLKIDILQPTLKSPRGTIATPLPDFRWVVPAGFKGNTFQIQLCAGKINERKPDKHFKPESKNASGFTMSILDVELAHLRHQGHDTDAHRTELLKGLKAGTLHQKHEDESQTGKLDEADILESGKTYYWRVRTIHANQLNRKAAVVDHGDWSKWETFSVERAAPLVEKKDMQARRLTPRLTFELRHWAREWRLIQGLEYEIIPKSAGDFTGERALFIPRSELRAGWNNFTIQERLAPNVTYKWRVRKQYFAAHGRNSYSAWRDGGTIKIPANPGESFQVRRITQTAHVEEQWPAISADGQSLAYQAGYVRDFTQLALGDSIDPMRQQESAGADSGITTRDKKETNAGYLFTKKLTHDSRGLPLPSEARGAFAESLQGTGFTVFRQPGWAGKRIFFSSNQYDTVSFVHLSLMSRLTNAPATTAVVSAKQDESLLFPNVHPDGKTICYTRAKFDRTTVEEFERKFKAYSRGRIQYPTYARARKKLAETPTYEIWTCDVNGAAKTFITQGFQGRWSPDGTKLLYLKRGSADTPWEAWICPATGGNPSRVVQAPREGRILDPCWSRDGKRIAYVQRQSADGNDDIWVKDLKTFNASQITTVLDDDRSPVWGKDDKYILFVSEREGNFDIWSADVSKLK